MKTRNILISVAAAVVVLGAVGLGVGLHMVKANAVLQGGSLYVPQETTFEALVDSLDGKVRFTKAFIAYADRIGLTRKVKPGHYELSRGMNIIEIARMLNLGRQKPVDVIIRTVRLPAQLAQRVAEQLDADSAAIHTAMRESDILEKYGFTTELELFSIFIPNTYEMWWTDSPKQFIERMDKEYKRFWTHERRGKLPRTGLDEMGVITLASIVNEETNKVDEMPTIASVYLNRLRKDMKLQADPTVKYAMGDFALRRILHSYLRVDSPYNTYMHKGLPPTPICLPSIAAIDAVLDFKDTDYLYFCAKQDFSGYHNFATTYDEHLRNAHHYSAALNARNIK